MPDHVLRGLLLLTASACTAAAVVIALVLVPRARLRGRRISRLHSVALALAVLGTAAATADLIVTFRS